MKTRLLLVTLVGLAISFALLTFAQEKDLADLQATQKILALRDAFDEAYNKHDAAAVAAFYTHNAVQITDDGPSIGRQDIKTNFRETFQGGHPKNHISTVDGNAVHLMDTGGNELWATGRWSETGHGTSDQPIRVNGHWAAIFVREGDDWKIRMGMSNTTHDSVILIHESFTPRPAAPPSPTAIPGNQ